MNAYMTDLENTHKIILKLGETMTIHLFNKNDGLSRIKTNH